MAVQGPQERGFLANIFEHTINGFNRVSFFPKKADGKSTDWPSFYSESIRDETQPERPIQFTKIFKKVGFFLAGLSIGALIGAAIVFGGGAPLAIVPLMGMSAIAIAGGLTLPAVPFVVRTTFRAGAKVVSTAAGLAMDVLDNVFRKGPMALINRVRGKSPQKGAGPEAEEIEQAEEEEAAVAAPKESFKVPGVEGLEFSVSEGQDGKKIYTANKNLDELDDNDVKALFHSVLLYNKQNNEQGKAMMNMPYSSEAAEADNRAHHGAMIQVEKANLLYGQQVEKLKNLSPAGSQAPAQSTKQRIESPDDISGEGLGAFTIETAPDGNRIYKPHQNWTELTEGAELGSKRKLVEDMIAYEKEHPQAGGMRVVISGDPNVKTQDKQELGKLYRELGGKSPPPAAPAVATPPLPSSLPPPPPPALAADQPGRIKPPKPASPPPVVAPASPAADQNAPLPTKPTRRRSI